jgi:hypothetical protein
MGSGSTGPHVPRHGHLALYSEICFVTVNYQSAMRTLGTFKPSSLTRQITTIKLMVMIFGTKTGNKLLYI